MYLVPVKISPIFVGSLFFNYLDTNHHFVVKSHFGKRILFSRMNSIIEVEKANYENISVIVWVVCLAFIKLGPFFLSEFECSKMNNTISE